MLRQLFRKNSLFIISALLISQSGFASIEVVNIKTIENGDGYKTMFDLVDPADTSYEKPLLHIEGQFVLKPFARSAHSDVAIYKNPEKTIIAFTMKEATKAYMIGIVQQLKNGKISIDFNAGKKMLEILLRDGYTKENEWSGMYIGRPIHGGNIWISNFIDKKNNYIACFKILADGSYELVRGSFINYGEK